MSKKIYIILGVIVVAIVLYLYYGRGNDEVVTVPSDVESDLPAGSTSILDKISKLANEDTITLGTRSGSVTVKNFYKDYIETEEGTFTFAKTDLYDFGYDPDASVFLIALLKAPVNSSQKSAEDALLEVLDISQADACKLNVSVTAYGLNKDFGVKGLSFCPSTVKLN
jgi:hypothetical protein